MKEFVSFFLFVCLFLLAAVCPILAGALFFLFACLGLIDMR